MKDLFGDQAAWSAEEHLKLLEAIENYSFGNWKDIALEIGTRNAVEAKEEYVKQFIEGPIGLATICDTKYSRRPVLRDLVEIDDGPLGPNIITTHPLDICPQEAQTLYYYPLRDDFEIECDNQAETLVASLTLDGDDDDLEISLKLSLVDMYTERLRERERRHRMVRDYQLISKFFGRPDKSVSKYSKSERVLREKMLPFCQFYTFKENEQFIGTLMKQFSLSRRLTELLRYHKFGLTRFDELLEFEKQSISRLSPSLRIPSEMLLLGKKGNKKRHKKKLHFTGKKIHVAKNRLFRSGINSNRMLKKHQRFFKQKHRLLNENGETGADPSVTQE